MTTTIITSAEDLERFEYNGALADGALVRDGLGEVWLAFDSDEGVMCIRPRGEEDPGGAVAMAWATPVYGALEDLPLPLTITTEDE